ncbi:hypothetical protein QBC37DRAFT_393724 [Rhypophila decipiens]|uniref:PPPDE domain-containing protein n=1 Tax=Rhypophila decipiens TaxID=261697 RepID=A0AAN6XWT0_9PEZI|nr:hypothetical protein QBC37DRAFT_393724 [Rhypophila decipiens]
MSYQCEIVYRPLASSGSKSSLHGSLSSQKSSAAVEVPSSSSSSSSGTSRAKKGQPFETPPVLAHWAVAIETQAPYQGYESDWYYYGLVQAGEDAQSPKLCVIDTQVWDSLGKTGKRLSGLTNYVPSELLVFASDIISKTDPYHLTKNNCQDFAVQFFFAIADRVNNIDNTLKSLSKAHLGFKPLIEYEKEKETGDFVIRGRKGNWSKRYPAFPGKSGTRVTAITVQEETAYDYYAQYP